MDFDWKRHAMFNLRSVTGGLLCLGLLALGRPSLLGLEAKWRSSFFPVRQIMRITSLFGESRGDHFHNGIDFGGVQRVYPIREGRVVFAKDAEHNPMAQVFGTGNVVVLEHDEGIRTYYYHLVDGSLNSELQTVEVETPLGIVGNTGRSSGAHLHFAVEDHEANQLVNPLAYLPEVVDVVAPKIHTIVFKIKNKIYNLKQRHFFHHQSTPEVFVVASDLKPFYNPKTFITPYTSSGVYRIGLNIDGKVVGSYRFDRLSKVEGNLLTSSGRAFNDVYGVKQNYRFGEFIPTGKKHVLEAVVEDWAGNKSVYTRKVYFIPPQ